MIGLDWIGSFRAVIPNLYAEPSIDEEVEMVFDSTPISSGSLHMQDYDPLSLIFGDDITIICLFTN